MSFMSIYVNSCQFMPFMSFVTGIFQKFSKVEWGGRGEGGVKYVFLGLRRQLCCLAEGKNGPLSGTCMIVRATAFKNAFAHL
jgi:hypothetical protein